MKKKVLVSPDVQVWNLVIFRHILNNNISVDII